MIENYLWSGSTDRTIRVWDILSGGCMGVLSSAGPPGSPGLGHVDAVSCLEFIPPTTAAAGASSSAAGGDVGGEAFIASGGADGELKLWRPNGEFAHSVSHGPPGSPAFITKLKYFKDSFGGIICHCMYNFRLLTCIDVILHSILYHFVGQAALIIAFLDGSIMLRSCLTMELLFSLDASFHSNSPVWAIATIPDQSCFATAGDTGSIIVWRVGQAL